jgi:DNA-directed RNA polymerase specialized sigma24 family protein
VPGLLRFAYLVTGSQDGAEEAVQTALTKACELWPRIRRTSDPDVYVRRMFANVHVPVYATGPQDGKGLIGPPFNRMLG